MKGSMYQKIMDESMETSDLGMAGWMMVVVQKISLRYENRVVALRMELESQREFLKSLDTNVSKRRLAKINCTLLSDKKIHDESSPEHGKWYKDGKDEHLDLHKVPMAWKPK